jgi:hypothetical protein
MAYDKKEIYNQALEISEERYIFHVQDVIDKLPISKPTFYDYFKVSSNEFNAIKKNLENNIISRKQELREKMFNSNSAADTIALYKLIANDDERKALSTNWTETETKNNNLPDLSKLTYEQLFALRNGNTKDS